jgi:ABC-type phosphate/phosphonate transport system substrate-binding protein
MTSPSLTPEQEAKLTEALDAAKILEQQVKDISEFATAIANKNYDRIHEAALTAEGTR